MNKILDDMKQKGLYRNGLDPNNIYTWYSAETSLSKREFEDRIMPLIQISFNESEDLRSTLNRNGIQVWKLVE